jgi:type II secretory pathway pseudopilin PulG
MKRGFSLLEVVLAIGILGFSLPILLSHMADNASDTEKRIQGLLVVNAGKNVQNVLNLANRAPTLDGNHQAYCGYKGGIFSIGESGDPFDGAIFVLGREAAESIVNGSVERTTYVLYPWDAKNQKPRLTLPHAEVVQTVVLSSLGTDELKYDIVFKEIAGMQEGQAKYKASWAYAWVTTTTYGGGSATYGASQTFEYTSEINRLYIDSIVGNDAVAQAYAQALYNNLTKNTNNRVSNWERLKQDSVIGEVMKHAMDAQFAVIDALQSGEGGVDVARAAIQSAINVTYGFINSNEQYATDYSNTVDAYQSVYNYFTANPSRDMSEGPTIFKNNLNGTAADSYGTMAASILMSLGSTQNILDAYLSEK